MTPWTVAHQASLSTGFVFCFLFFLMQEYWSELSFPFLGDLSNPGIKPASPELQADSLPLSHQGSPKVNLG